MSTPLERIQEALQELVAEIHEGPGVPLVRGGVIAWESMVFDENGDAMFQVNYARTEGTSLASVIGILDLATDVVREDAF